MRTPSAPIRRHPGCIDIPRQEPQGQPEPNAKRILLVDDEPSVQEYLTTLLQREGYEVDVAPTCLDGFLHVIRNSYHCLILDLVTPDVNGLFLYHQVRRIDKDLANRTIVITGVEGTHPLHCRARDLSLPILSKPISTSHLFRTLDRYCLAAPA